MSKLTTLILGATALSLSFGAAQFALGRDLPEAAPEPAGTVNRVAKADRVASVAGAPGGRTRTISVRLDAFSDTSFLVRLAVGKGAGNPSSPSLIQPVGREPMTACEPVVSLVTEVAKLLQPGRCVT